MIDIFNGNDWLTVFYPEGGGITQRTQVDEPPSLREVQKLVGGYVELVVQHQYQRVPFQMLVNEEGRLRRMKPNIEGSLFLWRYTSRRDVLVGPVVVLSGRNALWK